MYSCRAAVSQARVSFNSGRGIFAVSRPNVLRGVSGYWALCFVREGVYFYKGHVRVRVRVRVRVKVRVRVRVRVAALISL